MYHAFEQLGFVFDQETYGPDIKKIYEDHLENAKRISLEVFNPVPYGFDIKNIYKNKITFEKVDYTILSIDDNIELWISSMNEKSPNIYNYFTHYKTGRKTRISDATFCFCSQNKEFAIIRAVCADTPFEFNLTVPNAILLSRLKERKSYECEISCFAINFSCYKQYLPDFIDAHPLWVAPSILPVGYFSPVIAQISPESSCAIVNGKVKSIETKTNGYTGKEFYHIVLDLHYVCLDVFMCKTDDSEKIEVGDILSVECYIAAK